MCLLKETLTLFVNASSAFASARGGGPRELRSPETCPVLGRTELTCGVQGGGEAGPRVGVAGGVAGEAPRAGAVGEGPLTGPMRRCPSDASAPARRAATARSSRRPWRRRARGRRSGAPDHMVTVRLARLEHAPLDRHQVVARGVVVAQARSPPSPPRAARAAPAGGHWSAMKSRKRLLLSRAADLACVPRSAATFRSFLLVPSRVEGGVVGDHCLLCLS